jgi:phosphatidylglycerophosphate synthase
VLYAALVAAGASLMVSYARARGESLEAGDVVKVGGMQRPERIVVSGVACALSPLADAAWGAGAARFLIGCALAALAVLSVATAVHRTVAIYRALRAAAPPAAEADAEVRPAFRLADVFKLDTARRRKVVR